MSRHSARAYCDLDIHHTWVPSDPPPPLSRASRAPRNCSAQPGACATPASALMRMVAHGRSAACLMPAFRCRALPACSPREPDRCCPCKLTQSACCPTPPCLWYTESDQHDLCALRRRRAHQCYDGGDSDGITCELAEGESPLKAPTSTALVAISAQIRDRSASHSPGETKCAVR